jgi:hypothetical protein
MVGAFDPGDNPGSELVSDLGTARLGGVSVRWCRLGDFVTRSLRGAKLSALVSPWAVRRWTRGRLLVPSVRPLEGRLVSCQSRIWSPQVMTVSTTRWYSGGSPVA